MPNDMSGGGGLLPGMPVDQQKLQALPLKRPPVVGTAGNFVTSAGGHNQLAELADGFGVHPDDPRLSRSPDAAKPAERSHAGSDFLSAPASPSRPAMDSGLLPGPAPMIEPKTPPPAAPVGTNPGQPSPSASVAAPNLVNAPSGYQTPIAAQRGYSNLMQQQGPRMEDIHKSAGPSRLEKSTRRNRQRSTRGGNV